MQSRAGKLQAAEDAYRDALELYWSACATANAPPSQHHHQQHGNSCRAQPGAGPQFGQELPGVAQGSGASFMGQDGGGSALGGPAPFSPFARWAGLAGAAAQLSAGGLGYVKPAVAREVAQALAGLARVITGTARVVEGAHGAAARASAAGRRPRAGRDGIPLSALAAVRPGPAAARARRRAPEAVALLRAALELGARGAGPQSMLVGPVWLPWFHVCARSQG